MSTVVIDPGHGGTETVGRSSPNNATGPGGLMEKTVTLDIAERLKFSIPGSPTILLTRETDVNLGLADRARIASDNNADVFLSIHFNGNEDPTVQGTETWVHSVSTDDSKTFAKAVQQRIVAVTGYTDRGVKSMGLGVLSPAIQSPGTAACLVEISFLTDPSEEARLAQDDYKNRIACSLGQAISDYLNHATSGPAQPIPSGDPNGDGDG